MRLRERWQRPALGLQPSGVAFGPGLLGGGEPPAVAEEKFREPVPGAQEVSANIFPTAQKITRGLFLLGGNVNRREGAGAIKHRELPRITTVGFDAIAR